jgi:hypothetical protein
MKIDHFTKPLRGGYNEIVRLLFRYNLEDKYRAKMFTGQLFFEKKSRRRFGYRARWRRLMPDCSEYPQFIFKF